MFLSVLDLGAKGLVWANALNMLFRILWCTAFIQGYLGRFGSGFEFNAFLPQPLSIAIGVGSYGVMGQLESTFTGGLMDLVKSGALSVAFVGLM